MVAKDSAIARLTCRLNSGRISNLTMFAREGTVTASSGDGNMPDDVGTIAAVGGTYLPSIIAQVRETIPFCHSAP